MPSPPKYVVYETRSGDHIAVLIPSWESHGDVFNTHRILGNQILSAGFYQLGCGGGSTVRVCCYGKSTGLKVDARPEDDQFLLEQTLGLEHP